MRWFKPVQIPTATMRDALSIFVMTAFVGALGVLFWKAIPKENEQLIVYMLGQLSGFAATIMGLYFVTKAGERELEKQRTENTAKALDAIKAAQESTPKSDEPQPVQVVNAPDEPVPVKEKP